MRKGTLCPFCIPIHKKKKKKVSTVPASKLDQDRRSVLGKRHLLYRLALAGVPLILRGTQVPHHLLEVHLVSTRSYVEPTVWGAIL